MFVLCRIRVGGCTLTTLWRDDPTRTLSDLPIELVEHTLGHFRQSVHSHEVRTILLDGERKFDLLLQRGRKVLSHSRFTGPLTDDDCHYLHDTHGPGRTGKPSARPKENR
jgi:hypothetical protein